MRTKIFILSFLALLISPSVQGQTLIDRVQSKYESLQSFTTTFVQELTNASTREVERRTGTIAFKKPRFIRWETTSPEKETLVVGKDKVWDYFPEEETVYVYPVDAILQSKTMIKFISGQANLKEDFNIELQELESGWQKIKLIPRKPEPNLVLGYIWIEPETALLKQVLLVDFFGNGNQLTFDEIHINPGLKDSLFSFNPPKGVHVQENREINELE